MDSHASARIKSMLSCLRDGLNIFSNDTLFPPTDVRLRLQNLQLSSTLASGGARQFGGAFEGQTHILGGQDRIFKKVLLFAHAVVTGLLSPPPGDSPPSQKGAIFLGIPPPGDEYPRNIAPPPEGRMPQEYRPPPSL